jgi:predicted  nucleic acid-binding Zn-ribbon protein
MSAEQEKIEIRCPKCGHVWRTKSKLFYVSCPSCCNKVKNPAFKNGR